MYFLLLFEYKFREKSNTLQIFQVKLCKEAQRLRTQQSCYITKWKKSERKMKEKGIKKAETPEDSRYYFGLINLED